jgi:hypothetical protein
MPRRSGRGGTDGALEFSLDAPGVIPKSSAIVACLRAAGARSGRRTAGCLAGHMVGT